MRADGRHDVFGQRVAGAVPIGVIGGLQADDLDVADTERGARAPAAIKIGQTGRARARPRQGVGRGNRQRACQQLAIGARRKPVALGLLALPCGRGAILGMQGERQASGRYATRGDAGRQAPAAPRARRAVKRRRRRRTPRTPPRP